MIQRDVSVVIPAYNAAGFIVDGLNSLLRQTQLPREVVVVDDGSTDATSATIESWANARALPFELKLKHQKNGGIASARNHGISSCTSTWIALLDADDVCEDKHIELLFGGLEFMPEAVMSYGAGRLFTPTGIEKVLYDDYWDNPSKNFGVRYEGSAYYAVRRNVFPRLIKGLFIKPSSMMFKRSLIEVIGDFNETLKVAEDREFIVRMLLAGNFVYCSTPITLYRWHNDNASNQRNARRNIGFGLRAVHSIAKRQRDKLSNDELSACEQVMAETSLQYLAVCVKGGTADYLEGMRLVRGLAGPQAAWSAFKLRHLGRSILWSLCR